MQYSERLTAFISTCGGIFYILTPHLIGLIFTRDKLRDKIFVFKSPYEIMAPVKNINSGYLLFILPRPP